MGDASQFHYGKSSAGGSGLEFTGVKKRSLFAQYTAQFNAQHTQHQTQSAQMQMPQTQDNWQAPAAQPLIKDNGYQQPTNSQASNIYDDSNQYAQQYSQNIEAAQYPSTPAQHLPAGNLPTAQHTTSSLSWLENDEVLSDIPSLKIKHTHKKDEAEKKEQRRSRFKVAAASLGSAAAVAVLVVSIMFLINNRPAITQSVKSKTSFPVYELASNNLFYVDKNSVEINSNGSLVYIVYQRENNARFVVSQQLLPEIVKDDAQYQQFLIDTDKFASFDSSIGKIYFTRPGNIGDDISAVLKTDQSLMFIRASGTTSEQTWMNLLNYLRKS